MKRLSVWSVLFLAAAALVLANLCIGSPASAAGQAMMGPGCKGKGISCQPTPKNSDLNATYNVDITYDRNAGILVTFLRENLSEADIKRMFSKPYYEQQNDLTLSDELCQNIGAPMHTTLKKGQYRFTQDGRSFRIYFGNAQTAVTGKRETEASTKSRLLTEMRAAEQCAGKLEKAQNTEKCWKTFPQVSPRSSEDKSRVLRVSRLWRSAGKPEVGNNTPLMSFPNGGGAETITVCGCNSKGNVACCTSGDDCFEYVRLPTM